MTPCPSSPAACADEGWGALVRASVLLTFPRFLPESPPAHATEALRLRLLVDRPCEASPFRLTVDTCRGEACWVCGCQPWCQR